MDDLTREITEKLKNEIRFEIPVFGGIPVSDSVFITWVIIAVIFVLCLVFVRKLEVVPTRKSQIYLEALVGGLNNFFKGLLGHEWRAFAPYLGTIAIYLAFANMAGIVGVVPPTKDLNVTAALSVMSITIIIGAGIKYRGLKAWTGHFAKPVAFIAPLNVLEIFIRPLSLCMRLFGNILGGFIIMELIRAVTPAVVPVIFGFYFDVFDGLIQAAVFVFLTTLFIRDAIE